MFIALELITLIINLQIAPSYGYPFSTRVGAGRGGLGADTTFDKKEENTLI